MPSSAGVRSPATETCAGTLCVVVAVLFIRIAVLILSLAAVGIAIVPLLVLVELLRGGTGYGICPEGISACDIPYSAGPEMVLLLVSALFALVLGIRLLMRLARRLRDDAYQVTQ